MFLEGQTFVNRGQEELSLVGLVAFSCHGKVYVEVQLKSESQVTVVSPVTVSDPNIRVLQTFDAGISLEFQVR